MDISYLILPQPDLQAIARLLDTSGHEARMRTVMELGRREMMRLFDAAAQNPLATFEDFVPAEVPSMRPVIHHGKNSLLAFTRFQKRLCRPEGPLGAQELWGYNEQELRALTGPGYFVAHRDAERGVVFDYAQVPTKAPEGWPPVRPNSMGLSRFVYKGISDVMRRLSHHVTIGYQQGAPIDTWFILVREDPTP